MNKNFKKIIAYFSQKKITNPKENLATEQLFMLTFQNQEGAIAQSVRAADS